MSRLLQAPMISFRCNHCGALSEDNAEKFIKLNTMPPQWKNKCAYCKLDVICSPSALIAKEVSGNFNNYSGYLQQRIS